MSQSTTSTRRLIELVRRGFHSLGVDVRRHRPGAPAPLQPEDIFKGLLALRDMARDEAAADEVAFLDFCSRNAHLSGAQLMQDLFVLYQTRGTRDGFFVEFGATDGVTINNTLLLERDFGWTGIVAEPAHCWHRHLRANRSCAISTDCVWHTSGERLMFKEAAEGEYSTLASLPLLDGHERRRLNGREYEVRTISLADLLEQWHAPRRIDYLSVDTEGAELEILRAFDFERYEFKVITVEHNYTPHREQLHALLSRHGYVRKFEDFSHWDDWYVRSEGGDA